jgi:hypothetical protein
VSGQLHASAALPPRKETPVPIGEEAGWVPEPVWTTWRREDSCPYRDSVVGICHYIGGNIFWILQFCQEDVSPKHLYATTRLHGVITQKVHSQNRQNCWTQFYAVHICISVSRRCHHCLASQFKPFTNSPKVKNKIEEHYLLGCDSLYSSRNILTFRRSLFSPISGLKINLSKQAACCTLLQNMGKFLPYYFIICPES